jgi:2-methylisocitrate lyase-like PEP mutase family enzyme
MSIRPERATELLRLHQRGARILLVINAWDVASAKLVEELGSPCVATTSGGVAAAHGYADGERIDRETVLRAVARIVDGVSVPVTADLEAGYGATPEDVAETVRLALAAGVAGFNLEDGYPPAERARAVIRDVAEQAERLRAAREACESAGVPDAVINARIDVFLREVSDPARRIDLALERAAAYAAAGARCVFPIGVRDPTAIRELAAGSALPVNVLALPGVPPVRELEAMGVRRVSVGTGLLRCALRAARRAASELRELGTYGTLFGDA